MDIIPYIDTTKLPDRDQRTEAMEIIGQVIGTSGTAPYVHLQLEMAKRLFGQTLPILVANDGEDKHSEQVALLAEQYGAEFVSWKKKGHAYGDLQIFRESMKWAKRRSIDVVVKLSRRFVPLVSWRHGLQYLLASNPGVAFFTRRHLDDPGGLFRTDAIAYRRRQIETGQITEILDETLEGDGKRPLNVENMFDSFQRVTGGWAMWDLLGPSFYRPWINAMQWRGLLPYHYGDLSRALGLPYDDIDFLPASAIKEEGAEEPPALPPGLTTEEAAKNAIVIQLDGKSPLSTTATDAPPTTTSP